MQTNGTTVLVTGASTAIGHLTALASARAGHTVYASMRDLAGRNADRAAATLKTAADEGIDLRVVELDVRSEESAHDAVAQIVREAGGLAVVVHNAGHMSLGYMEAYTVEEVADQFDVNAFSAHRVNRAALPVMRAAGRGTLLYIGSTTTVSVPPFLGPYVASKLAFDAIAQVTAYEVAPLGIETVIVMPGAFTHGTEHFANASRPADAEVAAAYASLDGHVARYGEATQGLFEPGTDPDPATVAEEVVRVLSLPHGDKPLRTVVDFTRSNVAEVNEVTRASAEDFLTRMGFDDLLRVR